MHPIEHLRYVARARGADPAALVEETAQALGSLYFDPAGLVVACRRIVERHPFTGPLWWLCATLSTSAEPFDAVWELSRRMRADPTASELAAALPDGVSVATIGAPDVIGDGLIRRGDVRVVALDAAATASGFVRRLDRHDVEVEVVDAGAAGVVTGSVDVVLVEALALDRDRVIAPLGSSTLAAAAASWGTPVWLVAGLGRRLPPAMVETMVRRVGEDGEAADPWQLEVEVVPTSMVDEVVGPTGRMPLGPSSTAAECPMAPELLRAGPM